jgi:hypothetical protein
MSLIDLKIVITDIDLDNRNVQSVFCRVISSMISGQRLKKSIIFKLWVDFNKTSCFLWQNPLKL